MIKKALVTAVTVMIASFGIAGYAIADPDDSQRNRGLGGRVFFVEVHDLYAAPGSPEEFFDNCYTFYADGTWDDPGFPVLGVWNQDSVGTKTSYTADALAEDFDIGIIVDILLEQVGQVTPAEGGGTLQLTAFSKAIFVDFMGEGDLVIGEFVSVGYEVDECPL